MEDNIFNNKIYYVVASSKSILVIESWMGSIVVTLSATVVQYVPPPCSPLFPRKMLLTPIIMIDYSSARLGSPKSDYGERYSGTDNDALYSPALAALLVFDNEFNNNIKHVNVLAIRHHHSPQHFFNNME